MEIHWIASGATLDLSKQIVQMSKLLQKIPSKKIESHQIFASQSDGKPSVDEICHIFRMCFLLELPDETNEWEHVRIRFDKPTMTSPTTRNLEKMAEICLYLQVPKSVYDFFITCISQQKLDL